MLASIFTHFPAEKGRVAAVCFNVKGPDLCFLDQPATALADEDRAIYDRLGVPASIAGVLVMDLDPTGAGREAKLRRGQIVMEVNRQAVTTPASFVSATAGFRAGDAVALLVYDPLTDQRLIVPLTLVGDVRR